MVKIKTGTLTPGKVYDLVLKHGSTERELERATVEEFKPYEGSDEVRYQARTKDELVGFLPENVLRAEAKK